MIVAYEKVTALDISMYEVLFVQVLEYTEQLSHNALHLECETVVNIDVGTRCKSYPA
jgi:hypothetical protein